MICGKLRARARPARQEGWSYCGGLLPPELAPHQLLVFPQTLERPVVLMTRNWTSADRTAFEASERQDGTLVEWYRCTRSSPRMGGSYGTHNNRTAAVDSRDGRVAASSACAA